jgi:hypothetical protein
VSFCRAHGIDVPKDTVDPLLVLRVASEDGKRLWFPIVVARVVDIVVKEELYPVEC